MTEENLTTTALTVGNYLFCRVCMCVRVCACGVEGCDLNSRAHFLNCFVCLSLLESRKCKTQGRTQADMQTHPCDCSISLDRPGRWILREF